MAQARVLVVDDTSEIREVVQDTLEMVGYEVESATNGEEGLRAVERSLPGLILLDIDMPVMNGWRFSQELKNRALRVPVVVMTATWDMRGIAQEVEADAYLGKPFDLDELLLTVEYLYGPPTNR
jgi:CheY-like chemotaxis protein